MKANLITCYSGTSSHHDYGEINESDILESRKKLENMEILIAYESVGSWGCDSSSYFLLRDKITKKLYECYGSHCSCYGFEGQLDLEETTEEALKFRTSIAGNLFYTGGYDSNSHDNLIKAKNHINEIFNN